MKTDTKSERGREAEVEAVLGVTAVSRTMLITELGVEITGQADEIGAAAHRSVRACQAFGRMASQMLLDG